jgi:ABC-type phosphate transport system substrate-binding protein
MTRRIVIVNALLAAAVMLAAAAPQILINAGGATFPYPIYSKWFDAYNKKFPNIAINYASIGSGGGVAQVTAGTVDFGASDFTMTDCLQPRRSLCSHQLHGGSISGDLHGQNHQVG